MMNEVTLKQCLGVAATTELETSDFFTLAHAAEQLQGCQHLCNPMPAMHQEHPTVLPCAGAECLSVRNASQPHSQFA